MSAYLSRDAILSIRDCKTGEVEVPEWGGTVRIRELSAAEVEAIGYGITTPDGQMDVQRMKGVMAKVVTWAVIDEDGNQVLTERDIKAIGQKSYGAINLIAREIMKLTGLSAEEEGTAEEEEIKNG